MSREKDKDLLTQEVCEVTSEKQYFTCQGNMITTVKNTGLFVTSSGKYFKFNITKRYEISIIALRSVGFNTNFENFPHHHQNVPSDIMVTITTSSIRITIQMIIKISISIIIIITISVSVIIIIVIINSSPSAIPSTSPSPTPSPSLSPSPTPTTWRTLKRKKTFMQISWLQIECAAS